MTETGLFYPHYFSHAYHSLFAQAPAKPQSPLLTTWAGCRRAHGLPDAKDDKGDPMRIENRIRWSDNGQLIKFVTSFISHNKAECITRASTRTTPAIAGPLLYTARTAISPMARHHGRRTLTQEFSITHLNGKTTNSLTDSPRYSRFLCLERPRPKRRQMDRDLSAAPTPGKSSAE